MKDLPRTVSAYRRTPDFDETSVPAGLLRAHSTKAGVWGRIRVEEGRLLYRILGDPETGDAGEETLLTPGVDGVVEPRRLHEVRPVGPVRFHVEFLREDQSGEDQSGENQSG